jgi:serine/threonine protein kinase/tetratricopeptide (TPR) repeat protein
LINTRYEIIRKLGQGRSSVYLCKDIEFPGKEYAIKILPKGIDDHESKGFLKEFFVLKKLEHPNIIKPFGLGTVVCVDNEDEIEVGSLFITLEYFDGKELLNSNEVYNEKNLKEIVKQISSALYYLHQSKYIYYDLKPENILVSFKDDKPQIRLIDLGLAEYSLSTTNYEIKGTAHYIAPELLKKEDHNHSVDFYSLGIILYRILYKRFPFEAKNELDIYKAAIDDDIKFPLVNNYSSELISIIKKMVEKDVTKRYSSALALIKDLGFTLDETVTKEFLPARVFSSRNFAINVLSKYISDKTSSEVFTVKGFDGVGKTSLLNQIVEHYNQAILISEIKAKSGAGLVRYILRKIIFSGSVYPQLPEKDKKLVVQLMNKTEEEILDDLRSTIILLSANCKFILLIDDFNLFDQLSTDRLLEIIPFFQVNNIKVILSESSEHDFISTKLHNVREIVLGSFTDEETEKFLKESYSSDFPQKELQDLILSYADLIPGNIKSFIKDLIILGIMKFYESGVLFSDEEDKLSVLKKAHFAIYDLRLENLLEIELYTVKVISAIDAFINLNVLSSILNLSEERTGSIIINLQLNNIVQEYTSGQTIEFTSEAFKKHIYVSIENKRKLHLYIASKLAEKVPSFSRLELAWQYELAGDFENCFNVSMMEVEESEKHSAFEYIRSILIHLLDLPLQKKIMNTVNMKLSEVYYKLGDVQSALATIRELKKSLQEKEIGRKLLLIEGNALIDSREHEAGKKVISDLLKETDNIEEKQKLMVDLTYADYELKKYEEAIHQCDVLLKEDNLSDELKGRCYNLKGIIDFYQYNYLESALKYFELAKTEFIRAGHSDYVARVENNIGNIFTILNEYKQAEEHWKNASRINASIGNLEQEGSLLNNFGELYSYMTRYDLAVESYIKAQNIFLSLGNEMNQGLILKNLGEVYLKICEYQKSLEALKEAFKIFIRLQNLEKASEVLTFLGKLFFNIGSLPEITETINSFEKLVDKVELPSKCLTNLRYLRLLNYILKEDKVLSDDINEIINEYKNLEDKKFVAECRFLKIKFLIKEKNYKDAYDQLIDKELIDLCSQNSILVPEREYFFGVISRNYSSDNLLPPLEHFRNSYDLIKDENIFELTWKVLFAISELYLERGNLNKAKRYIVYTRELIYFIAEKIESHRLRAAYLKQKERISVLEKLENFYPAQ